MNDSIFSETQYLRTNPFLRAAMFVSVLALVVSLANTYKTEQINSSFEQIISIIIVVVIFTFLFNIKLQTEVKTDALYIKLFPLHINWQVFNYKDIKLYNTITYRPIRDYGGWGIRYGRKGKAYNAYGNRGVLFILKKENGKEKKINVRFSKPRTNC
jgi:hypothetical protein